MENRRRKLAIKAMTFAVSVFDLFTDWYALGEFVWFKESEKDMQLTIAVAVICVLSTLVFGADLYHAIKTFKVLRAEETISSSYETKEERALDRLQEIITFFQIILEDFPITVVMYVTFRQASCPLFHRIFEDGFVGNLILLAAFLSALWKMITAFCYCCCRGYHGIKCSMVCCCCCCRLLRSIVAILLMGFAAYLFFTFNREGTKYRSDCYRP